MAGTGKLHGALLTECSEWVWEQLQEEGYQLSGELIDLIFETERELGIQAKPLDEIARVLEKEFRMRGIQAQPFAIDAAMIRAVLDWEDDFLGFAGTTRAES